MGGMCSNAVSGAEFHASSLLEADLAPAAVPLELGIAWGASGRIRTDRSGQAAAVPGGLRSGGRGAGDKNDEASESRPPQQPALFLGATGHGGAFWANEVRNVAGGAGGWAWQDGMVTGGTR